MAQHRRRIKQIESLEMRLPAQAKELGPGAVRDEALRKARQCETGSHLRSPGLHPPR